MRVERNGYLYMFGLWFVDEFVWLFIIYSVRLRFSLVLVYSWLLCIWLCTWLIWIYVIIDDLLCRIMVILYDFMICSLFLYKKKRNSNSPFYPHQKNSKKFPLSPSKLLDIISPNPVYLIRSRRPNERLRYKSKSIKKISAARKGEGYLSS